MLERESKIKYPELTESYLITEISRHWGLKPWEFENLKSEQKSSLIASYHVSKRIKAYIECETLKNQKKEGN